MTAKKPVSALDQPWRWHAISTPVLFAGAVYAAGGVIHATAIDPWYVGTAAILAAPIATSLAVAFDATLRQSWYTFITAACVGMWLTGVAAETPWSRLAALTLLGALIVLGPLWVLFKRLADAYDAEIAHQQALIDEEKRRDQWPNLLALAGFPGIRQRGARIDVSDGVYSVRLVLPPRGVTLGALKKATEQIEIAGQMRLGSIRFEAGATAADVVLHVFERDVLADTHLYPIVREPRSIHNPMPLGVYETGEIAVVTMREIASLMVGTRGTGKSALLNTHLAYLTGCTDALVWMIDSKGGRTARPWLEPFLAGTTGRPALDWVAFKGDEIDAMLTGGLAAIEHRSKGKGEKVIPSPQQPAIILIVEEASMVFGSRKIENAKRAAKGTDVVVLGRSEAVDPFVLTQRGTVTMVGGGDMKSQFQNRYGLGVASADDARDIFNGNLGADLFKATQGENREGVYMHQTKGMSRVAAIKGLWLTVDLIPGVAQTNVAFRPDLDQGTADAVHAALLAEGVPGGYYMRWDRYAAMSGVPVSPVSRASVPADVPSAVPPSVPGTRVVNPNAATTAERYGLPPSKLVPSPLSRPEVSPVSPDGDAGTWEAIVAGWDKTAPEPVPPARPRVPSILTAVAKIFTQLDAERLHTKVLIEYLPGDMTGKRLGTLLNLCGVTSAEQPFDVDGTRARGYLAADVHTALGQAQSGRTFLPNAYDWPGK